MRMLRVLGAVGLMVVLVGLTGLFVSRQAKADESPSSVIEAQADLSKLCRYGVNSVRPFDGFAGLNTAPLRLGWYLNYTANKTPAQPAGTEFVPVIRLTQVGIDGYTSTPSGAALLNAIAAKPGAKWLVGNEPDRRGSIQDNIEPHVYATAYHDLYHLIKDADPTARILAGTIVQPTPVRLQYLDMVLNSYHQQFGDAMPVDGWSIHNFILNEKSCIHVPEDCWGADIPPGIDVAVGEAISIDDHDNLDIFKQRIVRFRNWMKARGYGDKPLHLTEYGILMPPDLGFEAPRVNAFMNATFDYMTAATDPNIGYRADGNRLVQSWSWYSLDHDTSYNGWLFDTATKQMTAVGQNFAAHSAAIAEANDFLPYALSTSPGTPIYEGSPLSLQLTAEIANAGNLAASTGPVMVRFYRGNPAQGGVQIGGDQLVNLAGCGDNERVSVTWNGVGAGTHRIFVVVDPGNTAAETNEGNNTGEFDVFVGTEQNFIPRVAR